MYLSNVKIILTILEGVEWNQLKRNIDIRIEECKDKRSKFNCSICCLNKEITRVFCSKCSKYYCITCYINLFRSGSGIITCPFCRFSIGHHFPEDMIELGVQSILTAAFKGCKLWLPVDNYY